MLHRRDHLFVYVDRLHCRPPLSTCIDSNVMGRSVDLDDLIDVGEVAALLGLAHKNSVTTYLRRYADFPAPALEFAEGNVALGCERTSSAGTSAGKRTTDVAA